MFIYLLVEKQRQLPYTPNLDMDQKLYQHSIEVYFQLPTVQLKFGRMGHGDAKVV